VFCLELSIDWSVLEAKLLMLKPFNGEFVTEDFKKLKRGSVVTFSSGGRGYDFQATDNPTYVASVREAARLVGWTNLMPWAKNEPDMIHQHYISQACAQGRQPPTLTEALAKDLKLEECGALAFIFWPDVYVERKGTEDDAVAVPRDYYKFAPSNNSIKAIIFGAPVVRAPASACSCCRNAYPFCITLDEHSDARPLRDDLLHLQAARPPRKIVHLPRAQLSPRRTCFLLWS